MIVGDDDDVGQRADVVLGRRVPGLSRRAARALGLRGVLRCNGKRVPPSHRVAKGDRLELELEPTPAIDPPRVLACTDAFVYVDKPADLHTHRLRPSDPPALADAVARVHPECAASSDDPREGGALHRLDRETTGVVAFARTPAAWRAGRAAIVQPTTLKLYVALCETPRAPTWPPRTTPALVEVHGDDRLLPHDLPRPRAVSPLALTLSLGRGATKELVAVREDGRPTTSILVPLAAAAAQDDGNARLLVALQLHGGHRHQARVHLAWLGVPIEGDARYGHGRGALALHCSALDLSASCPGEQRVDAPLPAALAERLAALPLRPWA
ncbi:MAG TPA: pseudouridine synthase [Nannocystaceae bacterium]|nr:pseudouridine synthase [Nannocystaceae bacterium]